MYYNQILNTEQDFCSSNFSISDDLESSSKSDTAKHPAILQLFATGYEIGDRVVGRNISVFKGKGQNHDWAGVLTEDNIRVQEWDWHSKSYAGPVHEDGLSWLEQENIERGIFFHVNGGRDNDSVSSWKTVFFEHDYGTFEEQRALIDGIPRRPTVQVETRKSNHTYYGVWSDLTGDLDVWAAIQEKIAYIMGSDPSVKDRPRLMRLAGFDHVKEVNGQLEYKPCTLVQYNPSAIYTIEEVVEAFEQYAKTNGIKPFSQKRFKAYQYVISKLRQKEGHLYNHENFSPDYFRTCEDSELDEHLERCKVWARNIEKGIDHPETAWTEPLVKVRESVKQEYEFSLVPAKAENKEPLTVTWARKYTIGFLEQGRGSWHTCKCPVHGGNSDDSLHIHTETGALKCHAGCDPREILIKLRHLAKYAGDETWNWQVSVERKTLNPKTESELLNTLTINPKWHYIKDCYKNGEFGLTYNPEQDLRNWHK